MAKLKFDDASVRQFETGCDHGVLFVKNTDGTYEKGVAWNGLISVTESPEGAEANAIYADNQKYLNLISAEEFKASLECYTYPDEFGVCNGEFNAVGTQGAAVPGLRITQQPRRPFALVFRTKMGTADNPDMGYKLHIIYGCTASPAEKAYETVNDSPDAATLSFDITCTPEQCAATPKPVYHLEVDEYTKTITAGVATWTKNAKYALVEEALYGTDGTGSGTGTDPTFKTPDQIIAILTAQG